MKTNNFFLLHMLLVRKGMLQEARYLLRNALNRPGYISISIYNNTAWNVSQYVKDFSGYGIKLTY